MLGRGGSMEGNIMANNLVHLNILRQEKKINLLQFSDYKIKIDQISRIKHIFFANDYESISQVLSKIIKIFLFLKIYNNFGFRIIFYLVLLYTKHRAGSTI